MFKLEFDTGNAAFDGEDAIYEIGRILRGVAKVVGELPPYSDEEERHIYDVNGNKIGKWRWTRDD